METFDDSRATTWLDGLSPEDGEALHALGEHCTVTAGREVVVEGSLGCEVYVVLSGLSRVVVRGNVVARLGRGSFMGEMSLLDGRPRSATVVAESLMELLVFDPVGYQRLFAVPGAVHEQCRQLASRLRDAQAAEAAMTCLAAAPAAQPDRNRPPTRSPTRTTDDLVSGGEFDG